MIVRKAICLIALLLVPKAGTGPGRYVTPDATGGSRYIALAGQPADTIVASQPTSSTTAASQAVETVNPLRSPVSMMEFFESAIAEDRLNDAQGCLNFERIDPEVVSLHGDEYVTKLAEILARLKTEKLYDRQKLPDDPTAETQLIGRDPLLLILQRYEYSVEEQPADKPEGESTDKQASQQRIERRWQFAESTVEDTPDLYARLDELVIAAKERVAAAAQPPASTPESAEDPLRSPYHTVQHFFISAGNAKKDIGFYKDAMECLDYSQVEATDFETKADYADKLYTLLEHMRATNMFDREQLTQQAPPDKYEETIGEDPFQLILTRGTDGRWRFRGRSVAGVSSMFARLEQLRVQETKEAGEPAAAAAVIPPELDFGTDSPQATMNQFITAMREQEIATAVACFDLSRASEADRSVADLLAGKLWMVLNRHKVILIQEIDNNRDRPAPYAVIKHEDGQIWIARQRSGPHEGEWLFTAASLHSIDRLYEAFEHKQVLPELRNQRISFWVLPSLHVREYLVPTGMKRPLGGLQVWQWTGLVALLVLGLLIRWLCGLILPRIGRRLLQTETTAVLPQIIRKALMPTSTLTMLITWWAGLQLLDLGAGVMGWTWWFLKIIMTIVGVYAFYRLIDVVMGYFAAHAAQTSSRLDDVLTPLLQKTLKVVIVVIGIILFIKTLGFQVTPLVAGLGFGGLAFGLAAQDTLKNFFGSVNVVLDRPFQVGDWVVIGDVDGTVESVGLRSSRIRTFYNSLVTVPNSEIMTTTIDNYGRRRYRRTKCMISVLYSTPPEKLEAFCEGIRTLIRQHPYTRRDYYHCWVNKFAASSIDILLYCFHEAPDWGTELRERHRLFLDIIRLAQRLGVEFAFPTQTVHLHHESNPSDSAPQLPPSSSADTDGALRLGAEEAAKLVREAFGDEAEKPPLVKY